MFQAHDSRFENTIQIDNDIPRQHITLTAAHIRFYTYENLVNKTGRKPIGQMPVSGSDDVSSFTQEEIECINEMRKIKAVYVKVPWLSEFDCHTTSLSSSIPIPVVFRGSPDMNDSFVSGLNYNFSLSKPINQQFKCEILVEPFLPPSSKATQTDFGSVVSAHRLGSQPSDKIWCSVDLYFNYDRYTHF